MESPRELKLIQSIIGKLEIDLDGLQVLTEAGSGHYIYTPLIAAMAGAKRIFVWLKDHPVYGKASPLQDRVLEIARSWGIDKELFIFSINERPVDQISAADIVTNLGHVRPIDENFISQMKPNAVIAYMSESWEFRDGDIDLVACRSKGTKIAGTWENYPGLGIFDAVGPLAVKLLFEAGLEVYQNRIAVIGQDSFGQVISNYLRQIGAIPELYKSSNDIISDAPLDALLLADYTSKEKLVDPVGLKDKGFVQVPVVHLCGALDIGEWNKGQRIFPQSNGQSFRMTHTLAHLGPKYVIDLHAAGLKVGELLYNGESSELIQEL